MNGNLLPRIILIGAIIVIALVMLIPTFLGYGSVSSEELRTGSKVKKDYINLGITKLEPIRLGLDLQGGMHVVLSVETDKAVRYTMESKSDDLAEMFKENNVSYSKMTVAEDNSLEMVFASADDARRARDLISGSK